MVRAFEGDERGASEILGFVLAFSLVMTSLAIYQADVVPVQNEQTEIRHNQQMIGEFAQLRATAQSVAVKGNERSVEVDTGTRYRQRSFTINPPPSTGRLWTSETYTVEMNGFETPDRAFWSGIDHSWDTRILRYRADYQRLQTPPYYALENGMSVKRLPETNNGLVLGGNVVSGDRIGLMLLGGDYSESGITETVSFEPTSAATDPVTVTADDASITMPTTLPGSVWEDLAADNAKVDDVAFDEGGYDPGVHEVTLELVDGEYDFAVSKVSLASPSSPDADFLTADGPTSMSPPADGSVTLTVTARDRFGNPVAGAAVTLSATSGTLSSSSVTTGPDGTATFAFDPVASGSQVTAELDNGASVTFTLSPGGMGGSSSMPVYTGGQMKTGLGPVGSIVLSDGRMVPGSEDDCLLIGDSGGLLGGLLGSINCDDDGYKTLQGSFRIDTQNNKRYRFTYLIFDDNENGNIDGSDTKRVVIETEQDGKVFEGELSSGAAQQIIAGGGSGTDLLESGSYSSMQWSGTTCGDLFSCYSWGGEYDSLSELDLSKAETLFVERAAGRVTVELSNS